MIEQSCASCGRAVVDGKHAEEWRDRGHRPQIVRELDPQKENAFRQVMSRGPGR